MKCFRCWFHTGQLVDCVEDFSAQKICPKCGIMPKSELECRVCGCQEDHACTLSNRMPCSWQSREDALCTSCADLRKYIAHCRFESFDVYCGRPRRYDLEMFNYGNPFTHLPIQRPGLMQVGSVVEAVTEFRYWALEQRELLSQLAELQGKILGCFCKSPQNPLAACHCEVLALMANRSELAHVGWTLTGV